jgi:nitroimidazol reductase NimA-like FMN-containing flavoprotein (pyridoxamine 5'-phosphate oxidase superfamily)
MKFAPTSHGCFWYQSLACVSDHRWLSVAAFAAIAAQEAQNNKNAAREITIERFNAIKVDSPCLFKVQPTLSCYATG